MASFQPANRFDRVFEISIILKAIDGGLEIIGGLLLLVVKPETLFQLAKVLTQHELSEDPNDFIARHLLHSAQAVTAGAVTFAAIYLLSHGIAKVVLVVEIFRGHLWAYKGLIALLGVFIGYQLYRIVLDQSVGLMLLTVFDAFVLALTIREERKQRSRLHKRSQSDS